MFQSLDFETSSFCNRRCSGCIRNSHPDREAISPWFEENLLSEHLIIQAIDDVLDMGFDGQICLSHYNEPLLDRRISSIAKKIKTYYPDLFLYLHTNGNYLTTDLAKELDGVLDRIAVTLYMDEPVKSNRAEQLHGFFGKTVCDVITQSALIPTHFSPNYDVKSLAEQHKNHSCLEPSMRVVINHRRQFLLCCDDVIGNFDLGTFPEKSIKQHWGEKMKIQEKLKAEGGRSWHSYCESCPRP